MVARYSIGVDLGGTKILTVVLDRESGECITDQTVPTLAQEGPDAVIDRIVEEIDQVIRSLGLSKSDVEGVGIGSPGPLNTRTGVVLCPPNLHGWVDIPLRQIVQQRTGLRTELDNDANVVGLAEWKMGAGRGVDNLIFITIGTGIGGAAIVDGRLQHGDSGAAAEFGHVMIDPLGARCGCGNDGCLEALASGTAIAREANMRPLLREKVGRPLAAEDVFELHAMRDAGASEVVNVAIRYLAIGLANYIHIYNPRRVIVGGGISAVGDVLFVPLRERLNRFVFPHLRDSFDLVGAELGPAAGAVGAALLVGSPL